MFKHHSKYKKPKSFAEEYNKLYKACQAGDFETVQLLINTARSDLSQLLNYMHLQDISYPLHQAIKNNHYNIAIYILNIIDSKAAEFDLNLTDKEYKKAIDLVMPKKVNARLTELLGLLIKHRKRADNSIINQYIMYCCNQYKEENKDYNISLICHYVSKLTGVNIYNLLYDENNIADLKYLSHVRGLSMLPGWQPKIFLPILCFLHFERLIRLTKRIDININKNKIKFYKQELLSLFFEELEMTYIMQTQNIIRRYAPRSHKTREKLHAVLSLKMAEYITKLPIGENYAYNAGYKGHSCYIYFRKVTDQKININIYNLLDYKEDNKHHTLIAGDMTYFYPYVMETAVDNFQQIINKTSIKNLINSPKNNSRNEVKKGCMYIYNILQVRKGDKGEALLYIYNKTIYNKLKLLTKKELQKNYKDLLYPVQKAKNCVVWNRQPRLQSPVSKGFFDNFKNNRKNTLEKEKFHNWVLEEETKIMMTLNLNKTPLQAMQDIMDDDELKEQQKQKEQKKDEYIKGHLNTRQLEYGSEVLLMQKDAIKKMAVRINKELSCKNDKILSSALKLLYKFAVESENIINYEFLNYVLPLKAVLDNFASFKRSPNKTSLLILGDAGTGKTMFGKYILKNLWDNFKIGDPIPIFIRLLHMKYKLSGDLLRNALIMQKLEKKDLQQALYDYGKKHGWLIILDGYDELGCKDNLYEIGGIGKHWGKNIKLITACRPEAIQEEDKRTYQKWFYGSDGKETSRSAGLTQVTLEQFKKHQMKKYIEKWYNNKKWNKNLNELTNYERDELNIFSALRLVNKAFNQKIISLIHYTKKKIYDDDFNLREIVKQKEDNLVKYNPEYNYSISSVYSVILANLLKVIAYENSAFLSYSRRYLLLPSHLGNIKEFYFDRIKSVREVYKSSKNPFFLSMVIKVFPFVYKNLEKMNYMDLFNKCVDAWFETHVKKLKPRIEPGSILLKSGQPIKTLLRCYAENLAVTCFKNGRLDLSIAEENTKKVLLLLERPKDVMKNTKMGLKRSNIYFLTDYDMQILRAGCLLKTCGDAFNFIHKSLLEYFFACELRNNIILYSGVKFFNKDFHIKSRKFSFPVYFEQLIQDPAIIKILASLVSSNEQLKQPLYRIIIKSKTSPEARVAAANSITILNISGERFSGRDFSNVRIGGIKLKNKDGTYKKGYYGANLSGGIFGRTNFSEADLRGIRFYNAYMYKCNFKKAYMQDIRFIGQQNINAVVDFKVTKMPLATAYAVSPNEKLLAVAKGLGRIVLWDTANFVITKTFKNWKGSNLIGNFIKKMKFSSDGKYLAVIGYEIGVISTSLILRIWDVEKNKLHMRYKCNKDVSMQHLDVGLKHKLSFSKNSKYFVIGLQINLRSLELFDLELIDGKTTNKIFAWNLDSKKIIYKNTNFSFDITKHSHFLWMEANLIFAEYNSAGFYTIFPDFNQIIEISHKKLNTRCIATLNNIRGYQRIVFIGHQKDSNKLMIYGVDQRHEEQTIPEDKISCIYGVCYEKNDKSNKVNGDTLVIFSAAGKVYFWNINLKQASTILQSIPKYIIISDNQNYTAIINNNSMEIYRGSLCERKVYGSYNRYDDSTSISNNAKFICGIVSGAGLPTVIIQDILQSNHELNANNLQKHSIEANYSKDIYYVSKDVKGGRKITLFNVKDKKEYPAEYLMENKDDIKVTFIPASHKRNAFAVRYSARNSNEIVFIKVNKDFTFTTEFTKKITGNKSLFYSGDYYCLTDANKLEIYDIKKENSFYIRFNWLDICKNFKKLKNVKYSLAKVVLSHKKNKKLQMVIHVKIDLLGDASTSGFIKRITFGGMKGLLTNNVHSFEGGQYLILIKNILAENLDKQFVFLIKLQNVDLIGNIKFSKCGAKLYCFAENRNFYIYNLINHNITKKITFPSIGGFIKLKLTALGKAAISPDEKWLAAVEISLAESNYQLAFYNVEQNTRLFAFTIWNNGDFKITSFRFTDDGKYLILASNKSTYLFSVKPDSENINSLKVELLSRRGEKILQMDKVKIGGHKRIK